MYVIYMDYPIITENIMDEPEFIIVNINATRGQLKKYGWKAYFSTLISITSCLKSMVSFPNLYFMNFIMSVAETDGVFTLPKSAL